MRLRALLDNDSLGMRLLGGAEELDRTVRGVMTTDLRDPSRYLSGGELVLTGLAWRRSPEESEAFVRVLAAAGVAGLAAGEAEMGHVPEDLVLACARHRMPVFAVSEDVAFATVTEHVVRQVSAERADDLAAVVNRHRRLMSSGPGGGGPEVVLDLLGSDLDLRAWVLSSTGRTVAGSADPSGAEGPRLATALPSGTGRRLAAAHLAAARTDRPGPHRVTEQDTVYSLFPIRTGDGRDSRETLLSDWLLAVEADADDWPAERLQLLEGVSRLIAVERERRDASRSVRRRLAQEVLELLQSGAPPSDVSARLRLAAPVLLPELGSAPRWQVVVAGVEWTGSDLGGGVVAQPLLEEALLDLRTCGPDATDRVAVARTRDEAIAFVPRPADGTDGAEGTETAAVHAETLLSGIRGPMENGLADDGRLTIGVSAAVHSAEGLRGALEEARHAQRVAAARPGRVCAAGHEELASHVLLLPFVPDDVRRAFTARLLDPLRDYDSRHRTELLATLEAFLSSDGSWTRCATRLHLHVNTLRYRIGRIEALTGRDLSRLEDKLDFFLALRMS